VCGLTHILDKRAVRAMIAYGLGVYAQDSPKSVFDIEHLLRQMVVGHVDVELYPRRPEDFVSREEWLSDRAAFAYQRWLEWWKKRSRSDFELQRAARGAG